MFFASVTKNMGQNFFSGRFLKKVRFQDLAKLQHLLYHIEIQFFENFQVKNPQTSQKPPKVRDCNFYGKDVFLETHSS